MFLGEPLGPLGRLAFRVDPERLPLGFDELALIVVVSGLAFLPSYFSL
jgi:hypothetical protein